MKKKDLKKAKEIITSCQTILYGGEKKGRFPQESVFALLYDMFWRLAFYEMVTHLWVKSDKSNDTRVGYNNPFAHIFLDLFWSQFTLNIRNLIDKGEKTHSLRRIHEKIKCNRQIITREAYLYALDLPYHYQAIIKREERRIQEYSTGSRVFTPRLRQEHKKAEASKYYHQVFDFLSGKKESERDKGDIIRKEIFDQLECKFDGLSDIKKFVDKKVAHREEPHPIKEKDIRITFQDAKEGLILLGKITNFIGEKFLGYPFTEPVPTPQFNHLENLDKPWATEDGLGKLGEIWNNFQDLARDQIKIDGFIW